MNIIKQSDIERIIQKYPIGLSLSVKYSDFENNETIVVGYKILKGQYYLLTEPLGIINVIRLENGL